MRGAAVILSFIWVHWNASLPCAALSSHDRIMSPPFVTLSPLPGPRDNTSSGSLPPWEALSELFLSRNQLEQEIPKELFGEGTAVEAFGRS